MIVSVTKAHIKAGKRYDCEECPIALALYDATGDAYVAVTRDNLQVGPFKSYKAPRSVSRFVKRFDTNKKVKPFRFILSERLVT